MAELTQYRVLTLYDGRRQRKVEVRVDLWIDVDKLARRLGAKALGNKNNKSHLAQGITAEVRVIRQI